jgi:hypothetical protein
MKALILKVLALLLTLKALAVRCKEILQFYRFKNQVLHAVALFKKNDSALYKFLMKCTK